MTTGTPPPSPSARTRRSRLRTVLPLGVAAWLVLEIWLLTVVAGAGGGLAVLLLLLAGVVLGAIVIKRAGRRAFGNLSRTLQAQQNGELPESMPQGGGNGLLMLAGLLLIIPGPVSDVAGLLLLLPPVRRSVARATERAVERRMRQAAAVPGSLGDAFQQARMHRPDGRVVPGEVIRDEDPGDPHQDPGTHRRPLQP